MAIGCFQQTPKAYSINETAVAKTVNFTYPIAWVQCIGMYESHESHIWDTWFWIWLVTSEDNWQPHTYDCHTTILSCCAISVFTKPIGTLVKSCLVGLTNMIIFFTKLYKTKMIFYSFVNHTDTLVKSD